MQYLSSDISKEVVDQEILIVLTPHIIRFPSISAEDLRTLAAGTDTNVRVYRDDTEPQAALPQPPKPAPAGPPASQPSPQMPRRRYRGPATAF